MGVIPNPKMAFIFPISCILALIFPILVKYFPKCVGKGSFPKSQIKSLSHIFMFGLKNEKQLLIHVVVLFIYKQTDRQTDGQTDRSFADV